MEDFNQYLIRLGKENPELRKHLELILDVTTVQASFDDVEEMYEDEDLPKKTMYKDTAALLRYRRDY